MPQFRVECIQQADGKFLAELYSPDDGELLARTETIYPTKAAALLAVIQLFKGALVKPKRPSAGRRSRPKAARRRAAPKRKAKKASSRKARKPPSAGRLDDSLSRSHSATSRSSSSSVTVSICQRSCKDAGR